MIKRSRLRTSPGRGRFVLYLVLAGCLLLLGHRFFRSFTDGGASFPFFTGGDTAPLSLIESRGTIYDRNLKELAITQGRVSIYAGVKDVNPDQVAEALAPILDIAPETLKAVIAGEPYQAWLAKSISRQEEESVLGLGLAGVHLHREKVRYYPEKETAAHLLGYVGKSMGLAGVEHAYNGLLNTYGTVTFEDAQAEQGGEKQEGDGSYLVLSLDLKIQRILEKFVSEQRPGEPGGKIAALLMESSSGKIIGAAQYPSYDPNRFYEYSRDQLENILSCPTAIPDPIRGILWEASLLQSQFEVNREVLPWSVHSVDRRLGSQLRLWDRLGLNDRLKSDFTVDETGFEERDFVRLDREKRFDSVPEVATPLQVAAVFNSLITGGSRVIPRVIDRIAPGTGSIIDLPAAKGEQTVVPVVATEVMHMLANQMEAGPLASGLLRTEATAYTVSSAIRQYWATEMIFGVIPRQEPRFMLFVFTNLPVFSPFPVETKSRSDLVEATKRIILPMVALQEVMANLSDMMTIEEKEEMNFVVEQQKITDNVTTPAPVVYHQMPDLKGLSLRRSLQLLNDLKLEIQISGTGVVVEQKPRPGEPVRQGELCRLVLKTH